MSPNKAVIRVQAREKQGLHQFSGLVFNGRYLQGADMLAEPLLKVGEGNGFFKKRGTLCLRAFQLLSSF